MGRKKWDWSRQRRDGCRQRWDPAIQLEISINQWRESTCNLGSQIGWIIYDYCCLIFFLELVPKVHSTYAWNPRSHDICVESSSSISRTRMSISLKCDNCSADQYYTKTHYSAITTHAGNHAANYAVIENCWLVDQKWLARRADTWGGLIRQFNLRRFLTYPSSSIYDNT